MLRLTVMISMMIAMSRGTALASPEVPTDAEVRESIELGIAYLLQDQNDDGSWGGPQDSITTWSGDMWSNPESHRAWKVATTGLVCAALHQTATSEAAQQAADRAIDFLIAHADVKRPNEWDTMNNWAYIYGLEGLSIAYSDSRHEGTERRERVAAAIPRYIENLGRFQSLNGGWGYLEFEVPRTRTPQWSTSFMTASAVVAMETARGQGFDIDQGVTERAVRAIQRSHLANGGYSYSVPTIPILRQEYINEIKGSLSRIEVCQAALMMAGVEIDEADRVEGLEHFFREHRFLDIAMHKPIPHETYYYNSGYFYLYGHYYAAMVIESLPAAEQHENWSKLRHEIMKTQQPDGSMWDYDMHRYDKPYGTAFSIMALKRSLPPSN